MKLVCKFHSDIVAVQITMLKAVMAKQNEEPFIKQHIYTKNVFRLYIARVLIVEQN